MAVCNEEEHIERKLQNLQQLDYPSELLEAIVVSDGSTDGTHDILNRFADSEARAILLPVHVGKAEALNRAMEVTSSEVIVFVDARQRIAANALKTLVEHFADTTVGCVSGALELGNGENRIGRGIASYWRIEKSVRQWESASGSTVGATGALYAVRRSLLPHLPAGLILDDVFIPMAVARSGARVIFEANALAWDDSVGHPKREFNRKVRTLMGNYKLIRLAPWLLTSTNPLRFEFISHKLFRLAAPFALLGAVFASIFLSGFAYKLPLLTAIGIGAFGIVALTRLPLGAASRCIDLAWAFVLLNAAALVAFFYFAVGKKEAWPRQQEGARTTVPK